MMADGDKGYGQQDPNSSTSSHNEAMFRIDQALALVNTAKLVQVKAVDTDAKTVDVLPLVKQVDGNGNATSHGTVNGIKYLGASQAGVNAVIMDPAVGDIGLMVCCDRDISAALSAKGEATPGSFRKHDFADGIYVAGLLGVNAAPTQWVKFSDTGLELADKNGNKLDSSSSGWAFTGPVTFNSTVDVKGAATLESTVDVKGAATLESTADIKGAMTAESTIDVKGATTLETTMLVKGAATMQTSIDVKGLATLEGNMQLTGSFLGASGIVYPNNMRISGTFQADTDVVGGTISMVHHVHSYIEPGPGFTGAIVNTSAPA